MATPQGVPSEEHEETSVDLLENEDRRILGLAHELGRRSESAVEERADIGNREKLLVRHFAAREAAVVDVAKGLQRVPGLGELGERFLGDLATRRRRMDVVEKMSRGVPGIDLNTGQDFDVELASFLDVLRPDLEWDLAVGIPAVRTHLDPQRCAEIFHGADYVALHAPVNVSPSGPKWWERMPVISRLVTAIGHLQDYPFASRDART